MFQYRNKVTGTVISVPCEVSGGDWEPVEAPAPKKPAAKKRTVKSSGELRDTK